ncbi:MAG: sigma-54-dependent Fis family transcriptional regulator [Bacteroidaceae bacterium]|nr:sigma-54-dependent Fis family transcriptional regulator [Bacteroidaceae bacterium]MBR1755337.1 sigma-54-dependent Fis family transcriptional regulator [Bacteroidaceae bacterium]
MDAKELQPIKQRYGIVGNCEALNHALDTALQVAKTDLSVLITGESGVGKEIIPRLIHDNSLRRTRKYFAINCGSIPEGTIDSELFGHEKGAFTGAIGEHEGYFGAADGGTLFLDEVGELPLSTQARLLRVLETGEYIRVGSSEVRKTNVRIVAATNVNIQHAIRDGKFREDLFYRLNTIPIKMPPLRERGEDILLLFKKFAMEIAAKYQMPERITLSPDAEEVMKRYKWPGNIRQLKNVTEQMSILMRDTRVVTPDVLSDYEIWPTIEEQGGLVRVGQGAADAHSYQAEREMLFQMINALHREVSELKQQVAGKTITPGGLTPDPSPRERGVVTVVDGYPVNNKSVYSPLSGREVLDGASGPMGRTGGEAPYAEEYVEESLSIDEQEKRLIVKALEKYRGRRKKAAEELHISERTLYRKIKEYGLDEL